MRKRYIASVSFGKDSMAMLLKIIELKMPLDEVVFYDTGMEFEAIYKLKEKIKPLLAALKVPFTTLHPENSFQFNMLEREVTKRDGTKQKGYSWCGGRCRWGTTEKLRTIEKHCAGSYEYIGIAADETERITKTRSEGKLMPLVEFGMSEKDCLDYCYQQGYSWDENGIELYSILSRVSCWCCANKNLKELKNYYLHLPEYFRKLKELQDKTDRPMKYNKYSVHDLEARFKREAENE